MLVLIRMPDAGCWVLGAGCCDAWWLVAGGFQFAAVSQLPMPVPSNAFLAPSTWPSSYITPYVIWPMGASEWLGYARIAYRVFVLFFLLYVVVMAANSTTTTRFESGPGICARPMPASGHPPSPSLHRDWIKVDSR
jgi:hypothetical protein